MDAPRFPDWTDDAPEAVDSDLCQSCGACCSTSAEWPRFTLEDDADLDSIPAEYVAG
jgi:Fe-S-cluster containining protein